MFNYISQKNAETEWDRLLLSFDTPAYSQSYSFSKLGKGQPEFITFETEKGVVACYLDVRPKEIKIPFGPVFNKGITSEQIYSCMLKIKQHYNLPVTFFLAGDDLISEFEQKHPDLQVMWSFTTPIIDTNVSIDDVLRRCNENRRRIIKKGISNFLPDQIRIGAQYAKEFYDLYNRRLNETGGMVDFSYEYLTNMLKQKGIELIVCLDNAKVIAGHIIVTFGNTMTTRYCAFDSQYAKFSPSARIDHYCIERACALPEILYYDMSGWANEEVASEKLLNINRYKKSYGPTIYRKYVAYKL